MAVIRRVVCFLAMISLGVYSASLFDEGRIAAGCWAFAGCAILLIATVDEH